MSELWQNIAKSDSLRQTDLLNNLTSQTKDPEKDITRSHEGVEGGQATACIVILTALKVEHKAVEAHLQSFGNLTEVTHDCGTVYTKGKFQANNCVLQVVIAQIELGNASAAMEAGRAIDKFNPEVILFVGVARGIKTVKRGDVVVANKVYGYESGKADIVFRTRPEVENCSYKLVQRAQAEDRKEKWLERIQSTAPDLSPNVHIAPIAAGEKEIASNTSAQYNFIQAHYEDTLAVEEAGIGLLKAVHANSRVSAIIIRGISDLITGDRETDKLDWNQIAASHASAFAFEVLAEFYKSRSTQSDTYVGNHIPITDNTLPNNIISLSLLAKDVDGYWIRAVSGRYNFEESGKFSPLINQITSLIESIPVTVNTLSQLDDYNFKLQDSEYCLANKFFIWFKKILERGCLEIENAFLLVYNSSKFDIPWELLEVEEMPLGVILQIVRQSLNKRKRKNNNYCCQGRVLAYTILNNQPVYSRYTPRYFHVFQEFLNYFKCPDDTAPYGLVFIDAFSFNEVITINPVAFIKRSQILKNNPSVVFINGSLNFAESLGLKHRDLLESFLTSGANGVVGILKIIDSRTAETVNSNFFERLEERAENSLLAVPAILKAMRTEVYNRLNQEDLTDEISSLYFGTFQYVYYGDPLTTLELTRSQQ